MSAIHEIKGKTYAVFGLGKSGRAAVKMLTDAGALVYAWDDNKEECRKLAEESVGKQVTVAPPETYLWAGIDALILSPGVPLTHPAPHPVVKLAKATNCPIICDIEILYHLANKAVFIGITGTNGKSTTTALTHHILKHAGLKTELGGNIGIAAGSLPLLDKNGNYVLEISSYQLDLLDKTKFKIAALLNITPDHIDRHGDMKGYIKAKERIFHGQTEGDAAIIAIDDENTGTIYQKLKESSKAKIIPVSCKKKIEGGVTVINGVIYDYIINIAKEEIEIGRLRNLPGSHNEQNIAVAYAIARAAGVKGKVIAEAVKTFPGLAHRIQYVKELGNIIFINDSKATNADSTAQALKCFDNIYWIAGGKPKEGGIASLSDFFLKIRHAFLIGQAQEDFAKTLDGKVTYTKCETLENAVKSAYESAVRSSDKTKPVILLSPACASFDQFKNFEERGRIFCDLVGKLISTL